MKAISLTDKINKYNPTIEVWNVDVNQKNKNKVTSTKKIVSNYWCKKGEEIKIITKNPSAWMIVVAAENKNGERFSIRWEDLEIPFENIEFTLD